MKRKLLSALLVFGVSSATQAAEYNFSYNDGTNSFNGQLTGIQRDADTVTVTSIVGFATIEGELAASLSTVVSSDYTYNLSASPAATVSFDGAFMDITACDNANICGFAFDVDSGNLLSSIYNANIVATTTPDGNGGLSLFVSQDWTLTVPEPSELLLLAAGLLGMSGALRRKNA